MAQPEDAKVNLLEFVLVNHTISSICFAAADDDLTPRHKAFMLAFSVVTNIWIAINIVLGDHGWLWSALVSVFVVLPLACVLRSRITSVSTALDQNAPCVQRAFLLRLEELALLGFLAYAVILAALRHSVGAAIAALYIAIYTFASQMVAEVGSLALKYLKCFICCACCLPKRRAVRGGGSDEPTEATPVLTAKPPHDGSK